MGKPDLKAKLGEVSHRPGIYLMKDRLGAVIYVGKARDLRKRLSSYFMASRKTRANIKTRALIDTIADFEVHEVRNEQEALLLEGKLIKEWRPRYNVQFRDDKRFLLAKMKLDDPWPRFVLEGRGRGELLTEIRGEMEKAAAAMRFERAALLRDVIANLEKTLSPSRRFAKGQSTAIPSKMVFVQVRSINRTLYEMPPLLPRFELLHGPLKQHVPHVRLQGVEVVLDGKEVSAEAVAQGIDHGEPVDLRFPSNPSRPVAPAPGDDPAFPLICWHCVQPCLKGGLDPNISATAFLGDPRSQPDDTKFRVNVTPLQSLQFVWS